MSLSSGVRIWRGVPLCLAVLGIITIVTFLPYGYTTKASGGEGLIVRTESADPGLPNFDIRDGKGAKNADYFQNARSSLGRSATVVADIRDGFVRGESELRERVPTLKVEYNTDIRIPEVITPDVWQARMGYLSAPSTAKRSEILRGFVDQNSDLIGVTNEQASELKVTADYSNPDGNLSYAHLEQSINGVPVFRGEVKAGFTRDGRIIRVINNLAPGLEYSSLSTDFGDPLEAVRSAARNINVEPAEIVNADKKVSTQDLRVTIGTGDSATTAEKMYFPTEPGVAVPAWRVLIWRPVNAYYVIVDANDGTMLWRKNITDDQTQSAAYNVYSNPNAMINVADNPFPMTPGPTSPNGTQGAAISRTLITRIGNEAPYDFNNNGWIPDGGMVTDGNAVQAGLDRDGSDGVDPNSEAVSPTRSFSFTYNPLNPNTNTGDAPVASPQTYPGSQFQQGSVTQLFYICNWYHDELYRLGFTEQARNFQNDNFGRGGIGGDRVRGEGQDSSGTNNANFSTPADGGRGRMQMYIWNGPNPDIDGNLDADVVIHEHTHGLSNRLHGNGSGLSTNMSGGMGEGWSDFYAHCLLSEPTDPINGIYTTGSYDTFRGAGTSYVTNYYYGIRRFPKAVMAFTGGPNNRPHNPLTFADADSTQFNVNDGAYSRGPFGSSTVDQVHNLGEIWSSALWEVRAKMITRLGWAAGNRKVLQLVTDGMKLAPFGPTFLQERDAIIAAAQASTSPPEAAADTVDVWEGFAIRGMGASAKVLVNGSSGSTRVVEAFDLPNLEQTPYLTVSDSTGDNDGFPEPGEQLIITVPMFNNTGHDASGTTVQISGGGTGNYGTVANASTVARDIAYTVPSGTACGSAITLTLNINSSLGAASIERTLIIGVPSATFTESFDGVAAPTIPAGWTVSSVSGGTNFVTTASGPDTAPNSVFALDPTSVGGGTDLTSPSIPISVSAATVSFRNRYDTEDGWDGGALEISIGGGSFQDIITAGGRFVENGYNGSLGAGANNPLANRSAWTGNSGGYVTTVVQLPAAAAGQNVRLKWRFGADDNTAATGWNIDTIRVNGTSGCEVTATGVRAPFDFDGDSKTDVSIFRPSVGEWWLLRSSDMNANAFQFGGATDQIAPGDFTGDGKADIAFFRPGSGEWYILRSEDGSYYSFPFGTTGDIPAPGDYDGDGKTDVAVFRPSTSTWFALRSSDLGVTITTFGTAGDKPVAADYDGDGKTDVAIFRPSAGEWWYLRSIDGGNRAFQFGTATDKPVQGDFTGDGKADVAFWRPSTGEWFVLRSDDGSYYSFPFGLTGDIPAPGDYDGDGKFDATVFRPSNNVWYSSRSTAGFLFVTWGSAGDQPVPATYVH